MKQLKYSLICEDVAHKTFIETVLPLIAGHPKESFDFIFDSGFFYRFKARNSKDVLKRYADASIVAFRDFNLDLLLIGVDYDDRDRNAFNNEIDYLYEKINEKIRDKSVIFFPVQAIEHWLLFIKFRIENPKSTKNISPDIEKIIRKKAKTDFFGEKSISREEQKNMIANIVKQIDIEWLISRSASFKRFNNDFSIFLTQINKQ
jgi:hypothetical protein